MRLRLSLTDNNTDFARITIGLRDDLEVSQELVASDFVLIDADRTLIHRERLVLLVAESILNALYAAQSVEADEKNPFAGDDVQNFADLFAVCTPVATIPTELLMH